MLLWMSSILKKIAKPVENHAVLEYFEGSALHRVAPVAPPPLADAKHGMQTRKKDHNTSEGGRAAGQKNGLLLLESTLKVWFHLFCFSWGFPGLNKSLSRSLRVHALRQKKSGQFNTFYLVWTKNEKQILEKSPWTVVLSYLYHQTTIKFWSFRFSARFRK